MSNESKAEAEVPAEVTEKPLKEVVTKASLEDKLKPDEDTNFTWPVSDPSKSWRFLLNGETGCLFTPSSITKLDPEQDLNFLLGHIVGDGKGIQLLNTVMKVFGRELAVKQDALIYTLAFCSLSEKEDVRRRAYELMFEICDQSANFLAFIDFREKICRNLRNSSGWSKGHRNAVNKWYQRKSPVDIARMVIECPKHNRWSHKDVLRLAHVAPKNASEKILFSFIIMGLKETLEKFRQKSEEQADDSSQQLLKFLEEVSNVRGVQDVPMLVSVVEKWSLSWDFVPCHLFKDSQLWSRMISLMPLKIMIQNTCRIAKMKLLNGESEVTKEFCRRCTEEKEIVDSKMHPYHILIERESYRNAMNDRKRKPSWKLNKKVLDALNESMSLAMKHNLVSTGRRYFITIDASDSMKAHISTHNDVQCRVAAACMSLCIARAEKKVIVKAFSKELAEVEIGDTTKIEDVVKKLEDTPLGGTDCARPIIAAKMKKIKTDVFIVFTDKDTWYGDTSPAEALRQYRKSLKIPAKLVVVALNPDSSTMQKRAADSQDRGMIDIYGFTSVTPRTISNFATYPY